MKRQITFVFVLLLLMAPSVLQGKLEDDIKGLEQSVQDLSTTVSSDTLYRGVASQSRVVARYAQLKATLNDEKGRLSPAEYEDHDARITDAERTLRRTVRLFIANAKKPKVYTPFREGLRRAQARPRATLPMKERRYAYANELELQGLQRTIAMPKEIGELIIERLQSMHELTFDPSEPELGSLTLAAQAHLVTKIIPDAGKHVRLLITDAEREFRYNTIGKHALSTLARFFRGSLLTSMIDAKKTESTGKSSKAMYMALGGTAAIALAAVAARHLGVTDWIRYKLLKRALPEEKVRALATQHRGRIRSNPDTVRKELGRMLSDANVERVIKTGAVGPRDNAQ